MSTPVTHRAEAQKLTADAQVDLYQIKLRNEDTYFRFKEGPTKTWQGNVYEEMAVKISGDTRTADGEESKPQLVVMNPLGVFNLAAKRNDLDLAFVTRRRVLLADLDADANIFEQRMWQIGRVPQLISGQSITFELKNLTEGANFQIPVRIYMPPEFPTVSL
ncbi:MAG: hypothetical protein EOQ39_18805 [Mesorhizobium sp.]|uniref:hypothetical protein n=1 Tax=Mesorhizobium sp. TaxID=1871066 RepID=UPI000FE455D6|nr:hypothetical protein [Mesorhizobium sp.]RWB08778.1 MAG: hypothetical protein EOQ37_04535 [Mesorhizobium sp.]RWB13571.1 MAG: hypothetical protein EOQ39_18805 [Mesorhizobium sp.]